MLETLNGSNVLVTGGNGFIGSHLVEKLVLIGANVTLLVREDSDLSSLEKIRDKVKICVIDFLNKEKLEDTLIGIQPEVIYHLMADIRVARDPELLDHMIENNFLSTFNFIRAIDKEKLKTFVNVGTCEEYGDNIVPLKEDYREIPVSPYSLSKTITTYLCGYLAKIEDLPIITVRPFLTYGPKQKSKQLIPLVIESMIKGEKIDLGKMETSRDFIHVSDVVSALVKVPLSNIENGEIINIGSGKEIQIKEVVKKICKITGRDFEEYILQDRQSRKGEMMHFYCSNEKAKKLLDWNVEVDFDEGLKETIDWWRN
jgi:UDP-glucose 4-epimerase